MRDPASTASGLTVFTRMPNCPPSSARQRARCASAALAVEYAAAYSTAKAAEAHLARCLAEEGGQFGIRVNTVNPDAVLAGSRIWDSSWRQERAATYGVAPDQLEEVYRKRTTLGVNILPEDIAEAVAFFASPTRSLKSTGNILNVDGGVAAAYPR